MAEVDAEAIGLGGKNLRTIVWVASVVASAFGVGAWAMGVENRQDKLDEELARMELVLSTETERLDVTARGERERVEADLRADLQALSQEVNRKIDNVVDNTSERMNAIAIRLTNFEAQYRGFVDERYTVRMDAATQTLLILDRDVEQLREDFDELEANAARWHEGDLPPPPAARRERQ